MVVEERTLQCIDDIIDQLKGSTLLSFDFETTGLDISKDVPVGIGIASDTGVNVYLTFRHDWEPCYCEEEVMGKLKQFFDDENLILIAHNLVFDIQFLWKDYNIDISWRFDEHKVADTQLMSWLDNENRKNHKLEHLTKTILKVNMSNLDDILAGKPITQADMEELSAYGKLDALATLELYKYFHNRLEKQKLSEVFWKVEMPYCRVLARMKKRGIDVNMELLDIYKERIDRDINELQNQLFELAGKEINFNSGKQLGELLFSKPPEGLGAPIIGYTAGGKKPKKDGSLAPPKPKTDKETFKILEKHEGTSYQDFVRTYQKFKKLSHTRSNFIDALRVLINSDGKIRTGFLQFGTVTGRLSSTGPNLQNQPRDATWIDKYYIGQTYPIEELYTTTLKTADILEYKIPDSKEELEKVFPYHIVEEKDPDTKEIYEDEEGKYFLVYRKIRDLYYNKHGKLIVADYSQIEMRLMGHFSQDENLLKAFEEDKDVHTWGAALVSGLREEEVTKDMRQNAKAVNFGTIYGKTPYGYAMDWFSQEPDFIKGYDNYGNPKINDKYLNKAEDYLNEFFGSFPGVLGFMDYTEAYCKKYGFVKTLTGRRRRLPAILAEKEYQRRKAKRQAINSRVQGSAGDYIKMAQILLERKLWDKGITQAIQVHDEIVFNPTCENPEQYFTEIKNIMENVVQLRVKVITEPSICNSWGQAK